MAAEKMHGAHDIFTRTTSEGIPFGPMLFGIFWGPGPEPRPKMAPPGRSQARDFVFNVVDLRLF